ncbi:MAG: ATP-binding protein [Candidatus Sedimenticola sp. (ex Thyasira tokunagai)]
MRSIHSRLLWAATLVLVAFLGLGGLALDRAYRDSLEQAVEARLMGHIYQLLGAAETDEKGRMRLSKNLSDPRFSNPDSGLYAQAKGEGGDYLWQSHSMIGSRLALLQQVKPGQQRFQHQHTYYLLNFGLLWEDDSGRELDYTFAVAESDQGIKAQISAFRESILFWFGGAALVLLLAQWAALRWGLGPLRQAAQRLKLIENGEEEHLEGEYPKELVGLVDNINSLIRTGRAIQKRHRNSLGDLAHSLKTPLAVLRGAEEGGDAEELSTAVKEQVPRMDQIVNYQLKRASAMGRQGLICTTAVAPVVVRLINTLEKVYREKGIRSTTRLDEAAVFPGDEGDLMELLGNLLENAFKYGRSWVAVTVALSESEQRLEIDIWDDGAGIPPDQRQQVLHRGKRADQRLPGQGIGLSVADEIVRLYGGELRIEESVLGGAGIVVVIPLAASQ